MDTISYLNRRNCILKKQGITKNFNLIKLSVRFLKKKSSVKT